MDFSGITIMGWKKAILVNIDRYFTTFIDAFPQFKVVHKPRLNF